MSLRSQCAHWLWQSQSHRICTNLFVCTVCRCAVGTPGGRALRFFERTLTVGRDHWARRCRNYRPRTNLLVCTVCRFADGTPSGRALRFFERTLAVGRDDPARRCRNYRPRTNLFVCTVCRFAVGTSGRDAHNYKYFITDFPILQAPGRKSALFSRRRLHSPPAADIINPL